MSEYDGYEDPGHEEPAADYPTDYQADHADSAIGGAIGQPLFEAGGYEPGGYEAGHEPGYEPGHEGGGEYTPYTTGGQEETGYAADSGDAGYAEGGETYTEPTEESGEYTATIDDLTGNTVSYSNE
jgi:hypothetical protein